MWKFGFKTSTCHTVSHNIALSAGAIFWSTCTVTDDVCWLTLRCMFYLEAAMSISHGSGRHRIELLIGDHVLPYTMTVYEAVKQFSRTHEHEGTDTDTDSEMLFGSASIWINTHTIWFVPMSSAIQCFTSLTKTWPVLKLGYRISANLIHVIIAVLAVTLFLTLTRTLTLIFTINLEWLEKSKVIYWPGHWPDFPTLCHFRT